IASTRYTSGNRRMRPTVMNSSDAEPRSLRIAEARFATRATARRTRPRLALVERFDRGMSGDLQRFVDADEANEGKWRPHGDDDGGMPEVVSETRRDVGGVAGPERDREEFARPFDAICEPVVGERRESCALP